MIPIDGELRHERRPARLSGVRDPALGELARAATDLVAQAVPPPPRRARTGTTSRTMAIHLLVLNWIRLYVTLLLGFTAVDLYQPYGICGRCVGGTVVAALFNFFFSLLIERAVDRLPPAASRSSARSTSRTSGGTSGTGSSAPRPADAQRDAVQGHDAGGCSACRVGRRLFDDGCLDEREDAGQHRRPLHVQRRASGCSPTRWRTASSSRTTSPSAPASRSVPRRSSTTGSRSATARCSRPTRSS